MKFDVVAESSPPMDKETAIVVPGFEDSEARFVTGIADEAHPGIDALMKINAVKGEADEAYFLPTPDAPYAGVLLLGLGTFDHFDAESLRRSAGAACRLLEKHEIRRVVFDDTSGLVMPIEAFIEGVVLGQYEFSAFKKAPEMPRVVVEEIVAVTASDEGLDEIREGGERTVAVCEAVNWARDLGNTPPTHMTARILAEEARNMAESLGLKTTIYDEQWLAEHKMEAFLGVARGSAEPPRLVIIEYAHPDAKGTLALVGKGVTFDTGGISIKPSEGMWDMKFDMCGAAAVLGAMRAIAALKPPVNVICAVPTCDNKTGPDAQVPGDIVRAYNGKTIEIRSTDAEGRMLLADTLAYVTEHYAPDAVVDAATLTGACVAALGHYAAGLFGNSEELQSDLELASEATGDRVWPLPLWDEYSRLIKGAHADLLNAGPRGEAGAITAAAFLKEFVGDTPWAHVDIAGTAWGGKHIPYLDPNHATGFGVRLFTQWVVEVAYASEEA